MVNAPTATKKPKTITQHGYDRTDDYAWLKADNWQEVMRDPSRLPADIRDHLEAENAYTQAVLSDTHKLQDDLFAEMKGRIKDDDSSVPEPDGPWLYYSRYDKDAQHPIFARKPKSDDEIEHILLDADALAKGHTYFDLGDIEHSTDHTRLAYSIDVQGSEYYQIYILDLATKQHVGKPIEATTGDFALSPCGQHIFWIWRDENGRPAKIFRREIGTDEDHLVYQDPDDGFFLSVDVSESDQYIFIQAGDHTTSETWYIPAVTPTADPQCFVSRETSVRYSVTHWGDHFYILTNADGAIDFKICKTPVGTTSRENWQDWLPHKPGRFITGIMAKRDYLIRTERTNALDHIIITDTTGQAQTIDFDEEAYALDISSGLEFNSDEIRFVYQSPTTPRQWYDYHLKTGERTLRKVQDIPSGHNPNDYITQRIFAKGHDGVEIPITTLRHKDTPMDATAPLLLYGYGAYGITMDATFSIRNLSLVNRGFIWATAHIRGGADKGYGWYLDGKLAKKTNTFFDFISCAEHLIKTNHTTTGNIVAYGGSAGGMLMGAIANMRPGLWAGIIAAVPFVDVLNTMSDDTLPLTPPEWPEWGNPITNKTAYERIASYSPYENVEAKPYPAMLITGGLSDPRVTYWEPTKWAAKLRDQSTSTNPTLLKINMEAGHGGATGRYDFLKDIALDYAFAIWAADKS